MGLKFAYSNLNREIVMFEDSSELRSALAVGNEGKRGAESLARMARALGYKDLLYFGQISHDCSWGDFIEFLEDNGEVCEMIKNWVRNNIVDSEEDSELDEEEILEV